MPRKRMPNTAWRQMIETEAAACHSFTGVVSVNVSGGHGSALAWHRCIEWFGRDRVVPVFADTNSEHADLYRFLDDCEKQFGQQLTRLNDGRNIWDVFDTRE
jgi:3'-phosphoadenosine 5'-phosphosulfate sulfotransferase (PAPS reductase)/FAD synthetase